MAKAIALTQRMSADPVELLRMAIVCGSALALIFAGHALPF